MDFKDFQAKLYECGALRDTDRIQTKEVDRVKPKHAEYWPDGIDARLHISLRNAGYVRPYEHQAAAISTSLAGNDVVMQSPTASGKTLSFAVPMLNSLVQNPGSHALMLYPMKALAYDQQAQLSEICNALDLTIATYDGDTKKVRKRELQANLPNIILTNPEYLNNSLLAHRDTLWKRFLKNLRFIVIDEMHEYRGIFGSNVALSLRRFFLHLNEIGAEPRIFLSTATCANPKDHAENLTGREVIELSPENVMSPRRHYQFVDMNVEDFQFWQVFQQRIVLVALAALAQDKQILIFCPSKRFIGTTLINCRKRALESGFDEQLIDEYYADLKAIIRRDTQKRIKSREVLVIFSTNALELGIDIGTLDGVVLAGFPPNLMSARQQVGRAGRRSDQDAFVVFYAMNDPIDHFYVKDIDTFLSKPSDHLVADPNNEQLIDNHIPSLIEETNGKLNPSDKQILGSKFYEKAIQSNARPVQGLRKGALQYELSETLRGGIGQSYELIYKKETLGQVSDTRRFRELYPGAVFPIMGRKYRVAAHKEQVIVLEDVEQHLRTDPHFFTYFAPNPPFKGNAYNGHWEVYYGTLVLNINPSGYRLVDERNQRVVRRGAPWDPYNRYKLHTVWFNVPNTEDNIKGIGAFENILRIGAMRKIPAERFDTSSSSECKDGRLTAYFFENYEGGMGLAQELYEVWPDAVEKGIEVAAACPCTSGCQKCIEPAKSWDISDAEIDKVAGIALAERLLSAKSKGISHVLRNGLMIGV